MNSQYGFVILHMAFSKRRFLVMRGLFVLLCFVVFPYWAFAADPQHHEITIDAADRIGSGTIFSQDNTCGISCGKEGNAVCSCKVRDNQHVTLLARPADNNSIFMGWGGACASSQTSPACNISPERFSYYINISAFFDKKKFPLSVSVAGGGTGKITSTPAGIDCGSTCSKEFEADTTVTLTAVPDASSTLLTWSDGSCSNHLSCEVTMSSAKSVTAIFVKAWKLTVNKNGDGSGTVTSAPSCIDCGSTCSAGFPTDTKVTLTAVPKAGYSFAVWSGVSCEGGKQGEGSCAFTMNDAKTVTATFVKGRKITITKNGNGSGTVTSSPAGIDCGTACSYMFLGGSSSITLTATPSAGSAFTQWANGALSCGTNSTCTLTPTQDEAVVATFKLATACAGVDTSGNSRSGTCSETATCSKGTKLDTSKGMACSGGMACCYEDSSTSGKCTDSAGQKCAADCSKETGYTTGGTGTCSDTASPQCCKQSSGSGGGVTTCSDPQSSGLIPCGRSCDNPTTTDVDESAICTLCHLFLLMKNVTSWIFTLMTYIAFTVLVAMGILYIVSAGNTQMIGLAKGGIKAALYGFAVVLLGWVAINVILMVLADGALGTDTASFSFKTNGSWFTYSCDAKSKYVRTGISGVTSGGGGTSTGGGGTNPGGNGTCDTATSGPCSVDSLKSTCFGGNAETISRLCNKESKGDPGSKSGVDICTNYGNRAFSGGLFQINVFANGSQLGDSRCNNLGSKGSCANRRSSDNVCLGWNCQINNISDFDYCMGLTFSASPNIKVACALSNNGSNLTPWACSANKCGLGGTNSNFCK